MRIFAVWTEANQEHLAQHGVTREEFEQVLSQPEEEGVSRSSGRPYALGEVNGRLLFCVYEQLDEASVLPITAFEID